MKNSTFKYLKILLIAAGFLFPYFVQGQAPEGNPIIDAKSLADSIKANNQQGILNIINANSPVPFKDYAAMLDGLGPDIVKLLNLPPEAGKKALFKPAALPKNSNNLTPEAGFTSTAGIDALGTFLADRFKQEVEIAFLDKFKAKLDSIRELQALLPSTRVILNQNDPYQYTTFLESLKEALNKDINNLPSNLGQFLGTDPYHLGSQSNTSLYFPAVIAYQNIIKITQGQSAITLLDTLDNEPLVNNANVYNSYFRLLAVMSRTLTNPASGAAPTYIAPLNIANALADNNSLRAFLGLFLIKEKAALKQVVFKDRSLYDVLIDKNADVLAFRAWIGDVTQSLIGVYSAYSNISIQLKASKPVTGAQVVDLAKAVIGAIHTVSVQLPSKELKIEPAYTQQVSVDINSLKLAISSLVGIVTEISDKNYGLALSNTIIVMQKYLPPNRQHVIEVVTKYGNFAVSVVKAQNANDMEQALNTAALPVGSYRIKRNSRQNFSLNAYAGIFGGYEHFTGSVPAGVNSNSLTGGFTAPVGLTFSWGGVGKDGKLAGDSHSIFLSAIDVGAVTSFRLTHDAAATLPNFTWQNVVAPGLFYVYGFKKSPLSLGGGAQYGPQLRSISDNSAEILPSAWNFRVFLAIDIPVFSFYTKTEK